MIRFLIILSLLVPTPSLSYQLVGLGDPKNYNDFQMYLDQNPTKKSALSFYLNSQIVKNNKLIQEKYKLATEGVLLKDLNPSIYLFKEILTFKGTKLYSQKSAFAFSNSFYRLSNLERDKSEYWITQALYYDSSFNPSTQIFNPNITSMHTELKTDIAKYLIQKNKSDLLIQNTLLYINGLKSKNSFFIHPSANYHLSIYAEGYQVKKLNLKGNELLKTKNIPLEKINFGTCNNPNFIKQNGVSIDEIYFSKNCIKSKPSSSQTLFVAKQTPQALPSTQPIKEPRNKPWYKKRTNWYYIAGGTLLTGLIVGLAQKDDRVEPVNYE